MTQENTPPVGAHAMDRVIWALRQAEQRLQTLKEQRLRPLGMAPAHYSLLISIHNQPGVTGAELARRLHVTPQSVASLVARLADKGARRHHPIHRHARRSDGSGPRHAVVAMGFAGRQRAGAKSLPRGKSLTTVS